MTFYAKMKWFNKFYEICLSDEVKSNRGNFYRIVKEVKEISSSSYYRKSKENRGIFWYGTGIFSEGEKIPCWCTHFPKSI